MFAKDNAIINSVITVFNMESLPNPRSRKRISNAVGIAGLVISFSVFIILMAQVWYDVSFDRTLPGSSRIYTFERPQDYLGDPNPFKALFNRPQIQTLREASPGVEAIGSRRH